MTTIAETLDVARSNLYEEKETPPSRHNLTETRRYYKKAEDAFFVPFGRLSMKGPLMDTVVSRRC
jgi:hypothetical protein